MSVIAALAHVFALVAFAILVVVLHEGYFYGNWPFKMRVRRLRLRYQRWRRSDEDG